MKHITINVQPHSHTKETDPVYETQILVDDDVSPHAEGSTFRTTSDGNHIMSPIRDREGNRVYNTTAGYLYSGYESVRGKKGCDALDFTKTARRYIRSSDKAPTGNVFKGAKRI